MPDATIAMNEIKSLEDRRYRAMLDADIGVLDALCSDDLIYTHSKGDHDDKRSYLDKVGSRHFTYLEITHPADRILVVDGAAKTSFMQKCKRDTCAAQALASDGKKLSGAAKSSFMKKCEAGA